jgi:hypothetical protein
VEIKRAGGTLPEGLVVAPLRRRGAVVVLDLPYIIVAGFIAYLGYKLRRRLVWLLEPIKLKLKHWVDWEVASKTGRLPVRVRMTFLVFSLTGAIDRRNRQGCSARAVGIRRVDVRTGGPVTVRSALIHHLAGEALRRTSKLVGERLTKSSEARRKELEPEIARLQREHADDSAAQQRALMAFYREHNVNPLTPLILRAGATITFLYLPSFLTPLRQSLPDLLAGIVTVADQSDLPTA